MTQYHFLDESGDPGLNIAKGASRHFVLAMVQMVERTSLTPLATVRQVFHFSSRFEFKYHKTTSAHKAAFFKAIRSIPFRVRAVFIDKPNLDARFTNMSGQGFIVDFIVQLTLRASPLDIAGDILIIDGAPPALCRALRIRLSRECRTLERVRPFSKIIGGDSSRDDGLQLADMVTGAIKDHFTRRESSYYQTFAGKIVDVWRI